MFLTIVGTVLLNAALLVPVAGITYLAVSAYKRMVSEQ